MPYCTPELGQKLRHYLRGVNTDIHPAYPHPHARFLMREKVIAEPRELIRKQDIKWSTKMHMIWKKEKEFEDFIGDTVSNIKQSSVALYANVVLIESYFEFVTRICARFLDRKKRGYWVSYFFFAMAMKLSIGMAGRVVIFTVPRAPSSRETRAIASLSGASTTLTKS